MIDQARSRIRVFGALIGLVLISACNLTIGSPSAASQANQPTSTPFPFNENSLSHVLTSENWSGYVVSASLPTRNFQRRQPGHIQSANAVSDVKAQWTVPLVTCGALDTSSAIWVGIDGETDTTVEQLGTGQDCTKGQPDYYAWFEIYPRPAQSTQDLSVAPGDTVSAEVQYTGAGKFTLSLTDQTSGQSLSVTRVNGRALLQSAEWVVEAPALSSGTILPLAQFGTVTFSGASVTIGSQTSTINAKTWTRGALIMANPGGTVLAYPSPLTSDGSGFAVAWRAS